MQDINQQFSFSKMQMDTLEAIADNAVCKATEAVAQMLGINMQISAIRAHTMSADAATEIFGDPEALTAAIYLKVDGSAPGHAAFLCPEDKARKLVDILLAQPEGTTQEIDELAESGLKEIGNIMTSSYLNALSVYTGLTLMPSPPQLAIDMCYSLVTCILVGSVEAVGETLTIVTEFGEDLGPLQGHFFYIPETPGIPVLLEHLKEAA